MINLNNKTDNNRGVKPDTGKDKKNGSGTTDRRPLPLYTNVDEYIAAFPPTVQKILQELRATIRHAAPDAEETISYLMPTFKQAGNLVHFAAYKNHIGFYPGPGGIVNFQDELSVFEGSKGTVRFAIDKPLPLKLISEIVKFRVKVNLEKADKKPVRG